MGDDEATGRSRLRDPLQQVVGQRCTWVWPMRKVRPLFIAHAERELVDQPAIDAGDRDRAAGAADVIVSRSTCGRSVSSITACLTRSYDAVDASPSHALPCRRRRCTCPGPGPGSSPSARSMHALPSSKSMVSRRRPAAIASRSGTRSMAIDPLGAEQHRRCGSRTGRPGRSPRSRRCRPARCRSSRPPCSRSGRCRDEEQHLLVGQPVGHLDRRRRRR